MKQPTPIHIVHGWTYTIENWGALTQALEEEGFKPILYKVPGLTEPSGQVWSGESYVEWLRDELPKNEPFIALGHSNGGRLLMAYEQKYPGSLKHLILIGSAGITEKSMLYRLKNKGAALVAKIIRPIIGDGKLRRIIYRFLGARDYGNAAPNMRETMKNMAKINETLEFEKLQMPVTMIWGEHDSATPLRHGLEMKGRLPNVMSWTIIKDAGHSPYINHAEDVTAAIIADLRGIDGNL